ncbi:hypothetical protein COU80_05220 [Candidatus Peregrinibacteria bacterium CG10_big_fil_rev_8_21_14_0_10_55_24]|nr:MAG: hypothetical protein COU80_05220 [Candidatus Peregrinibacteria bacterium CG10_big_fil_rev_8_21_14_0_10_55_24]
MSIDDPDSFLLRFFSQGLAGGQLLCVESALHFTSFPRTPMSYVVASKVKDLIKAKNMMSSGDLSDAASKMLEEALTKAVKRAQANGRKTVRPEDL